MRLPFSALLPWLKDPKDSHQAVLARLLEPHTVSHGAAYRQAARWARYDLNADQGDEAARALGLHPVEIWGNDYYRAPVRNAHNYRPRECWSYPEWEANDRFCGRPSSYAWGQK